MALPTARLRRSALRLPVFQKIWLASVAVVFLTAGLAGVAVSSAGLPTAIGTAAAALVAATGALLLQGVLVRLALRPVQLLAETAERVARGDESARVPVSSLADPQVGRLIEVFNDALARVASERKRLRSLAARAREVHESDRLRTAQQLHDSVAQSLGATLLRLAVVRRVPSVEARQALLDALRGEVASAADAVQRIAFSLRPPAIAELGASVAIQTYLRETASPGLDIQCDLPRLKGELSAPAETTLYRVVQEAFENALRHSGARSIAVRGHLQREWLEVEVSDDGAGFSVPSVMDGARCLGLFEMEERAEALGGRVLVESKPGKGTRVRIRLPRQPAVALPAPAIRASA